MKYLGRLAPSPTGLLHLGHAATFLVAEARALRAGGDLLLRIDDLDAQRCRSDFIEAAREDLQWLGLRWTAEFRQSHRLAQYRAALQVLLESGAVYPCSCSRRELQQAVAAPHEDQDEEPLYPGRCRPATAAPQMFRTQVNYRFRVQEGEAVSFDDQLCGPQRFVGGKDFGDFLVWRRDGLPSYQLATVVDEAELRITEVVRGRDLLKSTARQILLQKALGVSTPAYAHTELLRDAQGERLAKRHDALSLRSLRQAGATAEQVRQRALAREQAALHHTE